MEQVTIKEDKWEGPGFYSVLTTGNGYQWRQVYSGKKDKALKICNAFKLVGYKKVHFVDGSILK